MSPWPSVTVTLETVTPLFLAGAEARGAPELRPPSMRGAMRYWLRAALGGVLGADSEAVRRAEATVFGSTEDKLGGAGVVTVRISHGELPPAQLYQRGPAQRAVRGDQQVQQPSGRDYLYWSMAQTGSRERGNFQEAKQFLPPGVRFKLQLAMRPGPWDPEGALRQAQAALWLLVQLGGVGSRSRRTGGSVSTVDVTSGDDRYGLVLPGQTVEDVAKHLAAGLARIRADLGEQVSPRPRVPPQFDVLHPQVCRVWALGVWPSWEAAVDAIGAAMRDFRNRREPDHRAVARWLSGSPIEGVERAAFGLPLPFRYSHGSASGTIRGPFGDPSIDRRASPLWLKVSKTARGPYAGVATLFKAQFLPPDGKLFAEANGPPVPPVPPPADYGLIERFITEGFSRAVEVQYG